MFRHNIVYVATLLTSPNVRSTDLLHGLNILIVAVHAAPQSFKTLFGMNAMYNRMMRVQFKILAYCQNTIFVQ